MDGTVQRAYVRQSVVVLVVMHATHAPLQHHLELVPVWNVNASLASIRVYDDHVRVRRLKQALPEATRSWWSPYAQQQNIPRYPSIGGETSTRFTNSFGVNNVHNRTRLRMTCSLRNPGLGRHQQASTLGQPVGRGGGCWRQHLADDVTAKNHGPSVGLVWASEFQLNVRCKQGRRAGSTKADALQRLQRSFALLQGRRVPDKDCDDPSRRAPAAFRTEPLRQLCPCEDGSKVGEGQFRSSMWWERALSLVPSSGRGTNGSTRSAHLLAGAGAGAAGDSTDVPRTAPEDGWVLVQHAVSLWVHPFSRSIVGGHFASTLDSTDMFNPFVPGKSTVPSQPYWASCSMIA